MTTNPPADAAKLRRCLEKATPRPWRKFSSPYGNDTIAIMKGDRPKDERKRWLEIVTWMGFDGSDTSETKRHADCRLIVEAVNALPALLDLLAAQASQIEALRIQVSELGGHQRIALIDQDGVEVGYGFQSRKELLREEVYRDEAGDIWNRPTAWAYHQVCAARTDWQSRAAAAEAKAAKMREALLLARPHVLSQARAESMLDGFGQKKRRPIDAILELVDAALDQEERP